MLTALAGWGGRVIAAASQFAVIPTLTQMLGVSGYGAFAVLTALLTWFALADFGFGASLQNFISKARVSGENAADAVVSASSLLTGLSVVLVGIAALIGGWAGPKLLAGFDTIERSDAVLSFVIFATIAIGTGASTVAIKICFAEHRGYIAHLCYVVSGILSVIGLIVLKQFDLSHPFVWAIAIYTLPGWIVPTIIWLRQLRRYGAGRGSKRWNGAIVALLWSRARVFLVFNIMSVLVLNVDYIILSQTMAGPDVAIYAVYAKCYGLAFFIFNSILQAYWPVSAEALYRGDGSALRRIITVCLSLGTVVVALSSFALYIFAPIVQQLLLKGNNIILPTLLIPFFLFYWIIRVWSDTFAMIILSADKGMVLCIIVPFQAALNLVFAYYGARHFGIPGLLIGTSLSFVFTVVWALPAYLISHLKALGT